MYKYFQVIFLNKLYVNCFIFLNDEISIKTIEMPVFKLAFFFVQFVFIEKRGNFLKKFDTALVLQLSKLNIMGLLNGLLNRVESVLIFKFFVKFRLV